MIHTLSYRNVFFRVEKQLYTKKPENDSFSKRVYVFEGYGARFYLLMHYSHHKKQMNWKVNMRFHHLFGKVLC